MKRLAASFAVLVTAGTLLFPRSANAQATKLYYAQFQGQTLSAANPDGSSPTTLLSGLGQVDSVALNPTGGNVYWTVTSTGQIQRASLSGAGVTTLLSGLGAPRAIALNVPGGTMYWTEQNTNLVREANITGTGAQNLATESNPQGIALDLVGGHLFWSGETAGVIRRAGLDGSSPQIIVTQAAVLGLAVDANASKLYYTECSTNSVRRANFDGSNIETLVTGLGACPSRVAVDSVGAMFYFSDDGSGTIQRQVTNLSSGLQTVLSGLNAPAGVALLVPAPPPPVPALGGRSLALLVGALMLLAWLSIRRMATRLTA
jgi:DNA-binding beta-propeller fold protein YncE